MAANRNFNAKQALEHGLKDLYAKLTFGTPTGAEGSLATTEPIVLTSTAVGSIANGRTVTIAVAAAAANPTDTILAVVSGDIDAMTITITPNDGTNNTATPVDLTTAELAELIDSGDVVAKTVTLTDAESFMGDAYEAEGGDATALAAAGEGDGEIATMADGDDDLSNDSVLGIDSVSRNDVGDYSIILSNAYNSLKCAKPILLHSSAADMTFQIKSEDVNDSDSREVRILCLTAGSPADPADGAVAMVKLEIKDSSVPW